MFHKSIALLDDDEDDCALFQEALQEVSSASALRTTNSCLQLLTELSRPGAQFPDMIVMDLNMPKQDGFECLASLKVNVALKEIPVIVFSTSNQCEAIDRVYRQGATHYVTKPCAFQTLKQTVETMLTIDFSQTGSQPPREKFILKLRD